MPARARTARGLAVAVLAVVIAVFVSGCGGSSASDRTSSPAAKGQTVELKSVDPLRDAFNRDVGKARLLLLLSPT